MWSVAVVVLVVGKSFSGVSWDGSVCYAAKVPVSKVVGFCFFLSKVDK